MIPENPISTELEQVNEKLRRSTRSRYREVDEIARAATKGGKRIRPSLLILWARASSNAPLSPYQEKRMIQFASAIELIHVASLIHDDVVDESHLRRGKPSINAIWGTKVAVLLGDYILAKAMDLISAEEDRPTARVVSRCLRLMCEGEILQTRRSGDVDLDMSEYLRFIRMKTGVLMETSCLLGTMIADNNKFHRHARTYGASFGIAFQILDDIRDIIGDEKELGKRVRSDLSQGKLTAPIILLRDRCSPSERDMLDAKLSGDTDEIAIDWVIGRIKHYRIIDRCYDLLRDILKGALASVDALSSTPYRDSLRALAENIEMGGG